MNDFPAIPHSILPRSYQVIRAGAGIYTAFSIQHDSGVTRRLPPLDRAWLTGTPPMPGLYQIATDELRWFDGMTPLPSPTYRAFTSDPLVPLREVALEVIKNLVPIAAERMADVMQYLRDADQAVAILKATEVGKPPALVNGGKATARSLSMKKSAPKKAPMKAKMPPMKGKAPPFKM